MIIWTSVLYYTIHLTQLTLNTRTTSNSRHSEFITPAKRETNSLCQTTTYLLICWLISTQTVVHCASMRSTCIWLCSMVAVCLLECLTILQSTLDQQSTSRLIYYNCILYGGFYFYHMQKMACCSTAPQYWSLWPGLLENWAIRCPLAKLWVAFAAVKTVCYSQYKQWDWWLLTISAFDNMYHITPGTMWEEQIPSST